MFDIPTYRQHGDHSSANKNTTIHMSFDISEFGIFEFGISDFDISDFGSFEFGIES
jgi:hypothetical protein